MEQISYERRVTESVRAYLRLYLKNLCKIKLMNQRVKGAVRSKKKKFIYAPILMGFFLSEVKFNFKTLLFVSNFLFFLYIKSYSYFSTF